jgi:hypothetical protein
MLTAYSIRGSITEDIPLFGPQWGTNRRLWKLLPAGRAILSNQNQGLILRSSYLAKRMGAKKTIGDFDHLFSVFTQMREESSSTTHCRTSIIASFFSTIYFFNSNLLPS